LSYPAIKQKTYRQTADIASLPNGQCTLPVSTACFRQSINTAHEHGYDMVRYDTVDYRALKSRRDRQPNVAYDTEMKK